MSFLQLVSVPKKDIIINCRVCQINGATKVAAAILMQGLLIRVAYYTGPAIESKTPLNGHSCNILVFLFLNKTTDSNLNNFNFIEFKQLILLMLANISGNL